MNLLQLFRIRRQARQDAKVGVYQCEQRIVSLTGPRGVSDTEQYPDQGFLLDDLKEQDLVREHDESMFMGGDEDAASPPRIILAGGLLFFLAVGAVACMQLMAILGWSSGHRVVLGAALECLLITLTASVHRIASDGRTITWTSATALLLYVAFLISAAAVRLSDVVASNGTVTFLDWAAAALLVFVTAGPAWLAEGCLGLLFRGAPAARRNRVLNAQRRRSERHASRAKNQISRRGIRQRRWDEDFTHLKSLYDTTYYLEDAKLHGCGEPQAGHDGLRIVSSSGED